MSEIEPSSKKERLVYVSGRDRLSELPPSIIRVILSFVSTRDAVQMSIMSRQFRYTWISLPNLVFDLFDFRFEQCMLKFVTNVLKLHKGPIHKFKMSAVLEESCPIVDDWLLFLPKNEIRELNLNVITDCCDFDERHEVRPIVYSCNNLTHLELYLCKLGSPPLTFTGFLFLRCLILVDVYIVSLVDVEDIVAGSPLLEKIELNCCCSSTYDTMSLELRISAPSLKYFEFEAHPAECMQIHLRAPLLAEMSVSTHNSEVSFLRNNCLNYNYADFFAGCTNLRKLRGNFFNKTMIYGIDSCHYSFALPRLEVIELEDVNFHIVKETVVVARLMAGAPNLEKLKLSCNQCYNDLEKYYITDSEVEAPDASYMDVLRASNFKWEKLRVITMRRLTGLPSEIELLKLLLENSPALERMNLHTELDSQKTRNIRAQVLKCNVASPNFTLQFSISRQYYCTQLGEVVSVNVVCD